MGMQAVPYPVSVKGDLSVPPGRWVWLFKWLLIIPHAFILAFLYIFFFFVCIIAFFAILITGKYPRGLFDFNVGVMRWSWRMEFYSYYALGTDKYPPFSMASDPSYPADLDVEYPEKLSRGLVLIKWWLLAIPHYLIIEVWQDVVSLLALIGAIAVLFTGKYPKDIFDLAVGMNRWTIRVLAYASLMTDKYPPFRLYES
jgi:hypothetical protein